MRAFGIPDLFRYWHFSSALSYFLPTTFCTGNKKMIFSSKTILSLYSFSFVVHFAQWPDPDGGLPGTTVAAPNLPPSPFPILPPYPPILPTPNPYQPPSHTTVASPTYHAPTDQKCETLQKSFKYALNFTSTPDQLLHSLKHSVFIGADRSSLQFDEFDELST